MEEAREARVIRMTIRIMTEDTEDECQCDSAKEFIPVTFLPSNTAGSQCQAQKPSLVTDICGPRLAVEVYFTGRNCGSVLNQTAGLFVHTQTFCEG